MRFAAAVAFACVLLAGCRTTQPGAAMPNRADPIAAAANPEFDDAVLAIVYAMQGAAIGLFSPDPDTEVAHLAFLERLARRELARTRRD